MPSPAETCCEHADDPSYKRCGAGKWMGCWEGVGGARSARRGRRELAALDENVAAETGEAVRQNEPRDRRVTMIMTTAENQRRPGHPRP